MMMLISMVTKRGKKERALPEKVGKSKKVKENFKDKFLEMQERQISSSSSLF